MGQSNVLLRIHYERDFPLHTVVLWNKKRLFYGAWKQIRRGERHEEKKYDLEGEKNKNCYNFVVSSRQQTIKKGMGGSAFPLLSPSLPQKKERKKIASVPFFLPHCYVSNPCLVFLQRLCSSNAFQRAPFQSTMEYHHRSWAALLKQALEPEMPPPQPPQNSAL